MKFVKRQMFTFILLILRTLYFLQRKDWLFDKVDGAYSSLCAALLHLISIQTQRGGATIKISLPYLVWGLGLRLSTEDNKRARKVLWSLCNIKASVTRLGDLLHFGQVFKAFGNN